MRGFLKNPPNKEAVYSLVQQYSENCKKMVKDKFLVKTNGSFKKSHKCLIASKTVKEFLKFEKIKWIIMGDQPT